MRSPTPNLNPNPNPNPIPNLTRFDALSNYLSGIDHPDGPTSGFWPCDVHLIGKDIIWFHCVIWPAILLAVGLPLPRAVLAHGFVHGSDGQKMSKSLGNVVDPYDILA